MIKQLIKFSLNHIPRPVLQRIAGWAVPVAGLFYKGRGAECPVCGAKYRKFMPYGYVQPRPNALCPKCLSLERHRLLWLYLTRETDLLTAFPRTLHIAPEVTSSPTSSRIRGSMSRPISKARWPTCISTCSRSRWPTVRWTW